jgi:hypothetical protein
MVFALGGPLEEDDEVDAGFWASRMALGNETIQVLIKSIATRFGVVVSEKLLAESAPILGAAGGAFVNYTFMQYYQNMAHVHFKLRQIERDHDPDQVRSCFTRIVQALRLKP